MAAGVVARRRGGGGPRGARPGFAPVEKREDSDDEEADSDDEEADEVARDDSDDDDVTMRDPESTSQRAARKSNCTVPSRRGPAKCFAHRTSSRPTPTRRGRTSWSASSWSWRAWRRASGSRPKTLSIYQLPACLRCLSAVRGLVVTR